MRLRWFLTMGAVVALVAGLTVVLAQRLDSGEDGRGQVVSAPDASTSSTGSSPPATGGTPPGPGEVRVTGTVTTAQLTGAVLQPRDVATPLTVVSDRGFGNGGDVTSIQVGGEPSTIVWDGGRPFVLSSGGALVLDPVDVELRPEGLRLALATGVHALRAGTYQLDTPVAVGAAGIATSRDAVTFQAVAGSRFEPRGDASLVLGPAGPRRLTGPGRVRLSGTLELTTADGTSPAVTLTAGEGAYDLTFTPSGSGTWTVDGIVAGPIQG